jgi:hypothetical protein
MVAERDRLRALQMRVPRHRRVCLLGRALEDDARERDERGVRVVARVGDVKPEGGGDLVVARASGLDLAAHLAELALDGRVHVLVGGLGRRDLGERLPHLRQLVRIENARSVQALGVQQCRLNVVREQLGVVCMQELPHRAVERRAHAAGP